MVTSCPAATGPYWLGRQCPSHRCISRGGGRAWAGPGAGTYVQAGTRCPAPCCWDRHHHSSDRAKPAGVPPASPRTDAWVQSARHWGLPCATAACPQPGFEEPCPERGEPRLQQARQAPPAQRAPPAATLAGSCTAPSCTRWLRRLSPLRTKQLFVNLN